MKYYSLIAFPRNLHLEIASITTSCAYLMSVKLSTETLIRWELNLCLIINNNLCTYSSLKGLCKSFCPSSGLLPPSIMISWAA